jgi:hypothetical protein
MRVSFFSLHFLLLNSLFNDDYDGTTPLSQPQPLVSFFFCFIPLNDNLSSTSQLQDVGIMMGRYGFCVHFHHLTNHLLNLFLDTIMF